MNMHTYSFPKWLLIITALFSLMEIMVALSLFFSPQSVLENVDLTGKGVIYVVYMWAARQFALGTIFAVSLYKKSRNMLIISYVFFLIMFIGDLIVGLLQKETALIFSAAIMIIIAAFILVKLNRFDNKTILSVD